MLRLSLVVSLSALLCLGNDLALSAEPAGVGQSVGQNLQPPSAFASVSNLQARSVALFTEAGKVIQSPRCLNCHPVQRQPTQGDDLHAHVPFIQAGAENHGPKGLPCMSCHGPQNVATLGSKIRTVPGDPHWALAPVSMAWQGKSIGEICAQIKDPKRNGGRTLTQIHEHMATDHLVGWAWRPGEGRAAAPGTQEQFGSIIKVWISTGAHCPGS